jgi:hypothetical protein
MSSPSTGVTMFSARPTTFDRRSWTATEFKAAKSRQMKLDVGAATNGVWRPGIIHESELRQAFGYTRSDRRSAEQTLHLLVDALQQLFLAVEPSSTGLDAYGPRMREVLILACTEVEDAWSLYMRLAGVSPSGRGWNTNDYVRLLGPLYLAEFRVTLEPYPLAPTVRAFHGWSPSAPTQSLAWYDAYNQAKHDR